MRFLRIFERFFSWIKSILTDKQFLVFSSLLVGLTAGMAAVILKTFVYYIHKLITYNYKLQFFSHFYLIFPLIGILLTVLYVRRFNRGKLGRGASNIIYSILKRSGFLPKDQMYSHVISSAITVGLGGSAGLESPIVTTGAAIGSNFAKTYQLPYKDRILLLACGSAAGIAAAFNTPIAGVLFALEVLLVEVTISSFIPLIISAAVGTLCSKIILGDDILLSFILREPLDYFNIPIYAILGALCGLVAIYYARMTSKVSNFINRYPKNSYKKALIGGVLLMFLIYLFPPLFGEGYESIKILTLDETSILMHKSAFEFLNNNPFFILVFVLLTMLVKVFASALTIQSGGNGGNFAPSLFVGAFLGYLFAKLLNFFAFINLPINNFTLVGMAGLLSGIFYAPMTGIFLIAEITGGYDLIIPLMIVSAISYAVVKHFEPLSMDAKKLARTLDVDTQSRDSTLLSSLKMSYIVDRNYIVMRPDITLREIVEIISLNEMTHYPVVDYDHKFLGVVSLNTLREVMFKEYLYDTVTAKSLLKTSDYTLKLNESSVSVMKKFDKSGKWKLPVINSKGQFEGFIDRTDLLAHYREQLLRYTSN